MPANPFEGQPPEPPGAETESRPKREEFLDRPARPLGVGPIPSARRSESFREKIEISDQSPSEAEGAVAKNELANMLQEINQSGDIFELLDQNNERIYKYFARMKGDGQQKAFVDKLRELEKEVGLSKQELSVRLDHLKERKRKIEEEIRDALAGEREKNSWLDRFFRGRPKYKYETTLADYERQKREVEAAMARREKPKKNLIINLMQFLI